MQSCISWARDIIAIFKAHQIGYAYWSYKEMDFGLVDARGELINAELLRVISQRG